MQPLLHRRNVLVRHVCPTTHMIVTGPVREILPLPISSISPDYLIPIFLTPKQLAMGDVVTYILKSETLITVGRKKIVSRAQTCGPLQRIKPPVNSSNVTSQHLQTNKLSHVHSGHAMACSVETNVLNGGCKPSQN